MMYLPVNAWLVRSLKLVVTIGRRDSEIPFMKGKVALWWVWEGGGQGLRGGNAALPSRGCAILQ